MMVTDNAIIATITRPSLLLLLLLPSLVLLIIVVKDTSNDHICEDLCNKLAFWMR